MDMTAITTPWGLLDDDTREILVSLEDTETIEYWLTRGKWMEKAAGAWHDSLVYRVRPAPKPPAIELPWEERFAKAIDARLAKLPMTCFGENASRLIILRELKVILAEAENE